MPKSPNAISAWVSKHIEILCYGGMALALGFLVGPIQHLKFRYKLAHMEPPLIESTDRDMQYAVGMMYDHGLHVRVDDSEAVKWYIKAAEHGHVGACDRLEVIYLNGEGVPASKEESIKWREKAHKARLAELAESLVRRQLYR